MMSLKSILNPKNLYCLSLIFMVGVILPETSNASSALSQMFNGFAKSTNVTSPGSYQDQSAGYYTGGGLALRNRSNTLRPIRLSLPHIGANCHGIDAYFGGFSFIKGSQLTDMLRNMGSAAATYGFQLALKTISPQIESLTANLRKVALWANKFSVDECHAMQGVYASMLTKGSLAQQQACQDYQSGNSNQPDLFGARESCQNNPGEIDESIEDSKAKSPDLLIGEYNLTWEAMKKVPGLMDDIELAQYIMSVVGTVISRKVGEGEYDVFTKEGKGDSLEFIKANLETSKANLLVCDETQDCLDPQWEDTNIAKDQKSALVERVRGLINSIQRKYLSRGELSDEELNFLQNGHDTPIYRYIQVSAAAGSDFLMDDACHYMGISLILQQFESFSQKILSYLDNLDQKQKDTTQIDKFKKNLRFLRARIHQIHGQSANQSAHKLFQMIRTYEKIVAAR